MRAAVTMAPRRMEIADVPMPEPRPGEALIQIEAIGICGSDLHYYLGHHPYAHYPNTQGHELSGRIRSLPAGYEGPVQVGDRVSIEPLLPCRACYACRHGRPNCCTNLQVIGAHTTGGMAEFLAVPVERLYSSPGLDPELAAMVEPISIGLWAETRGTVTREDRVVVFGAGPIGQAILLAVIDRGARALVIDKVPARLDLARGLGAAATVDAGIEDPLEAVVRWTHGDGASVVFEAVGAPPVIRQAFAAAAHSGRIVLVGISDQEVSLPIIDFTRKELTVLGSRNNAGIFGDAVALVQRNQDKVRSLITHRFPLEEAPRALEFALEHPAEAEKVILRVESAR